VAGAERVETVGRDDDVPADEEWARERGAHAVEMDEIGSASCAAESRRRTWAGRKLRQSGGERPGRGEQNLIASAERGPRECDGVRAAAALRLSEDVEDLHRGDRDSIAES
jgi:hypothetical protein